MARSEGRGSRLPQAFGKTQVKPVCLQGRAGVFPAFFMSSSACAPKSTSGYGQAVAFLRVRFAGAGFSGSLGLRPSPMVLANAERAAA